MITRLTTATEAVNHWAPEAARIDHMLTHLDDLLPAMVDSGPPVSEETREDVFGRVQQLVRDRTSEPKVFLGEVMEQAQRSDVAGLLTDVGPIQPAPTQLGVAPSTVRRHPTATPVDDMSLCSAAIS